MSAFEDQPARPAEITGIVRLLPVPNLVVFPQTMQPLHIVEGRYCDLLEDASRGDRLIAMAVLSPGWEAEYDGRPRLGPFACLSRALVSDRLEDGTYKLLLAGLHRIRLLDELSPRSSYREAAAVACEDLYPPSEADRTAVLRQTLCRQICQWLPPSPDARDQAERLAAGGMSLGALTDVLAGALELDISAKEQLLGELDVHRRVELLLAHLEAAAAGLGGWGSRQSPFPPCFSAN